jgi:hypothetical protein
MLMPIGLRVGLQGEFTLSLNIICSISMTFLIFGIYKNTVIDIKGKN